MIKLFKRIWNAIIRTFEFLTNAAGAILCSVFAGGLFAGFGAVTVLMGMLISSLAQKNGLTFGTAVLDHVLFTAGALLGMFQFWWGTGTLWLGTIFCLIGVAFLRSARGLESNLWTQAVGVTIAFFALWVICFVGLHVWNFIAPFVYITLKYPNHVNAIINVVIVWKLYEWGVNLFSN